MFATTLILFKYSSDLDKLCEFVYEESFFCSVLLFGES